MPSSSASPRIRCCLGPTQCAPRSTGHPPTSAVCILPPTRSRASSTTTDAPSRLSLRAALRPLRPAPTTATSTSWLIVPGRRAEHDALQLADRRTAQSHGRVEALGAQLARVEAPAQLVEPGPVLLGNVLARRLHEDQV